MCHSFTDFKMSASSSYWCPTLVEQNGNAGLVEKAEYRKKIDQLKKALIGAVESGDVENMTKLIDENNIRINAKIKDRFPSVFCHYDSPLVLASKHGHPRCVKKLLEMGTNIYINGLVGADRCKGFPQDLVGAIVNGASHDYLECVQLLGEKRILNGHPSDEFYTHFMNDVRQHIDDQDYIFDSLERLNDDDRQAVLKGWKGHNLVSLLLLHKQNITHLIDNYKISVNGWDFNGLSPLMMAVIMKDLEAAKYLLTNGANVKASQVECLDVFKSDGTVEEDDEEDDWSDGSDSDGCGGTVLSIGACMRNATMLDLLLESTPPGVVDWSSGFQSMVPLMFAAYVGDTESVSVLFNHGADWDNRDGMGGTPLDYAAYSGNVDCLEFLLKRVDDELFFFHTHQYCIEHECHLLLPSILKYYNEPDFVTSFNNTHLMDAITSESWNCAQILIDNGHQVEKRNSTGMTALMMACLTGKDKGVELLLTNGADVNAQSNEGITPIMFAACKGHIKCMKLLLDFQADLDIVDHHKGTVFSAAMSHTGSCLDMLLDSGKLFKDSDEKCLKAVHRQAIIVNQGKLSAGNLITAIRNGLFELEWTNLPSLRNICFAVVSCGISPGKFEYKGSTISLLNFSLQSNENWDVLKYLIANLYFYPEDYACLIQHAARNVSSTISSETSAVPLKFYETISSQPLSLKTWSFLTISKAISLSRCSNSNLRSSLVKSLPLPEPLQMKLSFSSAFSQLCMRRWEEIGSGDAAEFHQLAGLMFQKDFFCRNQVSLQKCSKDKCPCEGLGCNLD